MHDIYIMKNSNGDSRTAKKIPSFEEFSEANRSHIRDVCITMGEISLDIARRGMNHDNTKIDPILEPIFYADLVNAMMHNRYFEDGEWAKIHYSRERHHLLKRVPEDVNLIDVLEMIVDCVCAGMARSGEVRPLEIDDAILKEAVKNTTEMIKNSIILVEE